MNNKKVAEELDQSQKLKRSKKKNQQIGDQIKEAQSIGLMQDVDLENKTPMQVKEEYTGELVALELSNKSNSPARYTLAQKSSAIFFMKCMQRPFKSSESGYIPMYDEVSLTMGIKKSVLKSWWVNKEKYELDAKEMKINLLDHVTEFQMISLLKIQRELDNRDLKEFSTKELLNYYDGVMNTMMRLSNINDGKPGGNVNQNNNFINLVVPKDNKDQGEIK